MGLKEELEKIGHRIETEKYLIEQRARSEQRQRALEEKAARESNELRLNQEHEFVDAAYTIIGPQLEELKEFLNQGEGLFKKWRSAKAEAISNYSEATYDEYEEVYSIYHCGYTILKADSYFYKKSEGGSCQTVFAGSINGEALYLDTAAGTYFANGLFGFNVVLNGYHLRYMTPFFQLPADMDRQTATRELLNPQSDMHKQLSKASEARILQIAQDIRS